MQGTVRVANVSEYDRNTIELFGQRSMEDVCRQTMDMEPVGSKRGRPETRWIYEVDGELKLV